ncbi:PREDICTED: uncharacterized protein LOC107164418 [Diuraphis noxia]|uniref:uncharacterized protein LOC107164418 n=1 Tax=Diuraphis noxia TaxID=143948 RepID=UPI0007639833|nr:PREDICTED: uncharacterized protein LOC107164418 [Diuraphis noxia]
MPRGFASTSSRSPASYHSFGSTGQSSYGKRHLAALARLGWLPSFRNPHSFYMRNGRGSYQCDINKRTSTVAASDGNVENTERSFEELGWDHQQSSAATEQAQTDDYGMKTKRYLLLPAVDNILLRRQYPHLATNKI